LFALVADREATAQAPVRKSSLGAKVFVVVTTALTTLAISYSFWFKNFGPGHLAL
jgi:hypothetical protein